MRPEDRERLPTTGWLGYLDGKDPGYPERALRADFATIRRKVEGMRAGHDHARHPAGRRPDGVQPGDRRHARPADARRASCPSTRASPPLPACATSTRPAAARPARGRGRARRIAHSQAATSLVLVNLNQSDARELVVQGGAYGEHICEEVSNEGQTQSVARALASASIWHQARVAG